MGSGFGTSTLKLPHDQQDFLSADVQCDFDCRPHRHVECIRVDCIKKLPVSSGEPTPPVGAAPCSDVSCNSDQLPLMQTDWK